MFQSLRVLYYGVLLFGILLAMSTSSSVRASIFTPPHFDPAGDTFGVGPIQHDITSVVTVVVSDNLEITVTFGGTIYAPSFSDQFPGVAPEAVIGYIDLDVDQSLATAAGVNGFMSHLDQFGQGTPSPGLGVDYFIDIGYEGTNPGFVALYQADGGIGSYVADESILFGTNSFTVFVPLLHLAMDAPAFLTPDDGNVDLAVIAGTLSEATDQSPNNSAVPEPSSLAIFGLGLACVATRWVVGKRRRTSATRFHSRRI